MLIRVFLRLLLLSMSACVCVLKEINNQPNNGAKHISRVPGWVGFVQNGGSASYDLHRGATDTLAASGRKKKETKFSHPCLPFLAMMMSSCPPNVLSQKDNEAMNKHLWKKL